MMHALYTLFLLFSLVALVRGRTCTVHAIGNGTDDAPAILAAFEKCGRGGQIVLPSENYTIAQPMTTHMEHARLDLHGYLSFTPDIDFWVANSYRFPFQNQSVAWHITGTDYVVDGHDVGGIFGNGQVWYSWAKGVGNIFGRPISVSITNSTRAVVKNFRILQPQFWSTLVWNSTDIHMTNFYVNATNSDPAAGTRNWVQNTDGSDSYQSRNVIYENWIYQGGDDCIAFKPNSTQIVARNITCSSANGIAFGSIGQYPDKYDILEDILVENVVAKSSSQVRLSAGTYFKSWIGVQVGIPPNGGGGGNGYCKNVTVRNVHIIGAQQPVYLTSNLSYSQLNQSYANTSTFKWDDIHFDNITGTSATDKVFSFDCSSKAPCTGWSFEDIDVTPVDDNNPNQNFVCHNFNATGLDQCHP